MTWYSTVGTYKCLACIWTMLGMYLKYIFLGNILFIFSYFLNVLFTIKNKKKIKENFHFLIRTFRKLDVTPDNLSCRTENGRSAVADLLISAAPPTPFPKQFAGSQTFDQSMLAYQCQSYSALARLRIGMRTQLAMPDPHGHLAMCSLTTRIRSTSYGSRRSRVDNHTCVFEHINLSYGISPMWKMQPRL